LHVPVMVAEVLEGLGPKPGESCLDGTLGAGGHAAAILARTAPDGILLGLDRDSEAVSRAAGRLKEFEGRCVLRCGNFASAREIAREAGVNKVDLVLLDLGISSDQLDSSGRGFSFREDGPLDMRMDRTSGGQSAADLVGTLGEDELRGLIAEYGEDRNARRIARAIVAEREKAGIAGTLQLAGLIERVCGRRERIHPATRTFQALRMAVNSELESLEAGLEAGIGLLVDGGRMAVISFHSLEDRIVKNVFRKHEGRWVSLQEGGRRWEGQEPRLRRLTGGCVRPGEAEIGANPRARSAKLRIVERIAA